MSDAFFHLAEDRGILSLSGQDRQAFLQGLVSNDLAKLSENRALHAAFLTPQGKYLHDFFILDGGSAYFLDVEGGRRQDLLKRLSLYKLRSAIALRDLSLASGDPADDTYRAAYLYGEGALAKAGLPDRPGALRAINGGFLYVDPRLAALGARAILPAKAAPAILARLGFAAGTFAAYDRLRLSLGIPDGSRDLAVEKAILLENGFDEWGSIDWQKGCYLGQELTARTKYRGLVKKRLLPVLIEGAPPPPGTSLRLGGEEAGEMRGADAAGERGLALIRLDRLERALEEGLSAEGARLRIHLPTWLSLPERSAVGEKST